MAARTVHIDEARRRKNAAEGQESAQKRAPKKTNAAKSAQSKKKKAPVKRVGGTLAFYAMLTGVVILLGLSVLMVVSASSGEAIIKQVGQSAQTATEQGKSASSASVQTNVWSVGVKHIISIALGIILALVIGRIPYRKWRGPVLIASLALVALLIAVLVKGEDAGGARRWIVIFGQSVQPSEFAKPVLLVLMTFTFYEVRKRGLSHFFDKDIWIVPTLILATSITLIIAEPETGNVIIILVGIAVTYLILELPVKQLGLVGAGLGCIFAFLIVSSPYRAQRILQYLGFAETDAASAWQIKQAKLAFGSGGLTGLGPGMSRQKYFYLPEAQNDFIIAIIGEELGLLGVSAVIGGFLLLLWGGFKIAYEATDSLGRALAGGALSMLMAQAILNIFSVTGLGPVTGKALPFVTLGGSSMLTSFILLGILLSVSRFGNASEGVVVGDDRGVKRKSTAQPKRVKKTHEEKPRRTRDTRRPQRKDTNDEDDLEWRWDSGSHIPGPGTRR